MTVLPALLKVLIFRPQDAGPQNVKEKLEPSFDFFKTLSIKPVEIIGFFVIVTEVSIGTAALLLSILWVLNPNIDYEPRIVLLTVSLIVVDLVRSRIFRKENRFK